MFQLLTTSDAFLIDSDATSVALSISRTNEQIITVNKNKFASAANTGTTERIDAIYGIFRGALQRYLIIITKSTQIGTILGSSIRAVSDFKIIPFTKDTSKYTASSATLQKDEKTYLALLQTHLRAAHLYFSYDYDITLNAQRIAAIKQDTHLNATSIPRRADERFFWNHYLCEDLLKIQNDHQVSNDSNHSTYLPIDDFVIPFMNGYIYQSPIRINSSDCVYTLFGRRSVQRAGRRFTMRGVDINGYAANTAETEQHVTVNEGSVGSSFSYRVLSFVQTRGSVPVLWEQPTNLKYAPKIRLIGEEKDTTIAFKRHFDFQYAQYGRQIAISLINHKGGELTLMNAFQYHKEKYNNNLDADGSTKNNNDKKIKLIHFDFHHECRKMKYENLSKLISQISSDMDSMQYFAAQVTPIVQSNPNTSSASTSMYNRRSFQYSVKSVQNGVFRSNCVDCLDRTNVVQNLLALHALSRQFEQHLQTKVLAVDAQGRTSILNDRLDKVLRLAWSTNADYMSIPYSGTPALKTDYTRTGKRSLKGYVDDGVHSVQRYFLNNFHDGDRQDDIDLALGYYKVDKNKPSPFQLQVKPEANTKSLVGQYAALFHPSYQRNIHIFFLRFALAFYCFLYSLSLLLPKNLQVWDSFSPMTNLILFAFCVLFLGSRVVVRYGRTYVNKPKLCPPEPYNPS